MPLVRITLVEEVFTSEEKHALEKAITDVMVRFEGSEAFREVVWVLFDELHPDGWHMGGRPFEGPKSLMQVLGNNKAIYDSIDGSPATRAEFKAASPPKD